ncbi:MAG TPA: PEP-CTERM sorting domain-containing protein [Candidatus Dormibacteraeota bacterium]|nr:PEP-CTERM sorting domain-containing protein [Candidatus Dormibacteraeota bacterium]
MTKQSKLTVGTLAIGVVAFTSSAATLVQDNFDSYANQAAFESVWAPIGTVAPLSAELSIAQASSGPNSIRVPGTASNSQSRNRLSFAETGLPSVTLITWSFDYYDSAPAASPQRNFANLQDTTGPSGTGQLISMGLNNNQTSANSGGNYYMARILGYTVPTTADPDGGPTESVGGSGAYFKLNDFGVGLRSLGWHNLKVEISSDDGLSADFSFYVDNQLAEKVQNIGSAATLRSYDNITIGSGLSNGSTEAFFDNMQLDVAPVPEPSVAVLGLLGIGMLFGSRRRH